jgi:hypothetical protein
MELRCRRPLILTSVVAVAAFSLVAAGCGGRGSPGVASITSSTVSSAAGSSATTSQSHALLLAGRCLRQHGIPNLPDPTIASSGPAKGQAILDKQFLHAVPSSVLNNAMLACRTALGQAGIGNGPNAGARTPQEIQDGLAFARCVRNHGIPNFPDPNSQGDFNLAGTGIDQHSLSPAELAAARTCLPTAHGAVHIPPQGTTTSSTGR